MGNVMVFPWVRRREPIPNVLLQFVTCQLLSAFPDSTTTSKYNRRFSLFMPLAISCRISNAQSDSTCFSQKKNLLRASRMLSFEALPSKRDDVQQSVREK